MNRLSGKTIVITGAAQGIGAIFATALAAEGARLALSDLKLPDATVARIREAGGEAVGSVCDVTDAKAVARMVADTRSTFGSIHGLVNNAALFAGLPKRAVEDISSEEFDRVMAINVRGSFECVKAVLPVMRKTGYGKIVNIASGTVFKGQVNMLSYVTSKGAIVAMTKCLARELGSAGIRVNCLAPGFTMSEGVKALPEWVEAGKLTIASRCLKREQTPEDLTGTLVYLLSGDSDFMTGQTVIVDGGSIMH
ncbi:MAG: SDR family oxidoreductase [Variovorax sp.]